MPRVFIGVGSNLGDRAGYLEFAKKELRSFPGLEDFQSSSIYETQPINVGGGFFLNAVWSFETVLAAADLLKKLQEIELKTGREPGQKNTARTLDLDILFYGADIIRGNPLIVPHPRLHERPFVLMPLCDLAPDWIHPIFKKTIRQLFNDLENPYGVRRIL